MAFEKKGNIVEEYEMVTVRRIKNVYDLTKIQDEMTKIQEELDNWTTLRAADKTAKEARLVELSDQLSNLQGV